MKKKQIVATRLQFFASLDDVYTEHADAFGEGDDIKDSFNNISSKLKELGYDVLINHREKAEFVPSSRVNEVVAQRETFKQQAQEALIELNKLKGQAGLGEEAKQQIEGLIQQNEGLLEQLKQTNIQVEIMSSATDAINPKDVIPFIDMTKVKVDKDGHVTSGVTEELERLRTEKPYLFNATKPNSSKVGFDGAGAGGDGSKKPDMNAAIRRAAFGSSRTF